MPFDKIGAKIKKALGRGPDAAEKPKSSAKNEAASKKTFAEQEQALKPAAKAPAKQAGPVAMPESTADLLANPAFKVAAAQVFTGEANIPADIAKLLLEGIAAEGVSDAKDIKTALAEYVDQATVYVQQLQTSGKSLTWVKFYAGDTEVGYMFEGGAMKYLVSDGWIEPR